MILLLMYIWKLCSRSEKAAGGATNVITCVVVLEFILMGTPESDIFIDPSDCPDLRDVVDDFGFDFNAGGEEWVRQITNSTNLKKYIKSTEIFMINPLRPKPLLVLDLDHTLLDFSRKTLENGGEPGSLKRPYMDFSSRRSTHITTFAFGARRAGGGWRLSLRSWG
ncbi:hypothetical protein TrST_g7480 [Triparma strigata]|uniref:FCP1 homology domain-containing protein n=1 Tax=Triparma strigata TaxID=1606541 RepID=A0A9W7BVD1_9STRA|nr:hypothetical protein TrST_g7480 [Triparma strigata]